MEDVTHEEDWAVYFCTVGEDQLGAALVDLGLKEIAPITSKPTLATITIFMKNPTEEGLSSADESEKLNQIEDFFIDKISIKHNAVYSGRLKFGGKILSYLYCEDAIDFDVTFEEIKNRFLDYTFEYTIKEENDWRAYFEVLYPSEFEMQVIQNGKVIENLESLGDDLQTERQVDHWIYFQTETDREDFLESIDGENFEIVRKDETSLEDRPFQLQIARVNKVDYQNLNEYVMTLWQKARECKGDYDGWETFVIKN